MLLMAGYRFIILSPSYIIPIYLQTVQNFRELQVGEVLALDRITPIRDRFAARAIFFHEVDPRWVLAAGAHA